MDKEVKKEVPVPQKTVMKIGRTEYTVCSYFSGKNTLFDILLKLMMIELEIED